MAVEGRRDAKVKERMEEEELRVQRGRMMKPKTTKRKANKRMKHLEDANLDGPDQLLLSKDQFSLEGGRETDVGECSGLVEGLETMPSKYIIYKHSQELEENVTQYMDGTMFQGVVLTPGPVVTSLKGGGGGEKVKVAET